MDGPKKRRCYFSAKFAHVLSVFMAKQDVRYYLNGMFITPAANKEGVLLVATDGHRMVVIWDKNGYSNGEWICQLSPQAIAAAKKASTKIRSKGANPLHYENSQLVFVENQLIVYDGSLEKTDLLKRKCTPAMKYSEYSEPVDGIFPKWERLFSDIQANKEQSEPYTVNPQYLADVQKAISPLKLNRGASITLFTPAKEMQPLAGSVNDYDLEIRFLIMPMRGDAPELLPGWLDKQVDKYEKRKALSKKHEEGGDKKAV